MPWCLLFIDFLTATLLTRTPLHNILCNSCIFAKNPPFCSDNYMAADVGCGRCARYEKETLNHSGTDCSVSPHPTPIPAFLHRHSLYLYHSWREKGLTECLSEITTMALKYKTKLHFKERNNISQNETTFHGTKHFHYALSPKLVLICILQMLQIHKVKERFLFNIRKLLRQGSENLGWDLRDVGLEHAFYWGPFRVTWFTGSDSYLDHLKINIEIIRGSV